MRLLSTTSKTCHLQEVTQVASTDVQLDNETKLQFYALFKQITEGENKTRQPSKLKVVERDKWDAWKKLGRMTK